MKKIVFASLLLLLVGAVFWNCEKDDICDESTATTPRIVLSFYDINDPTTLKNVNSLAITGEGVTDPIGTYSAVSTIKLPLKTTDDITRYSLVLNSTDATFSNSDNLEFNYARNDVYISRACGYKTLFNLDPVIPVVKTDPVADGFWIQNITVNQANINNEDETHVNIYF
ncbi:MAG: hypothetical protein EOO51_00900 [Flavobacterium sp.]|nr:MAG: hypothetical protein EOO51_00900 [Flavobacterium sp.]